MKAKMKLFTGFKRLKKEDLHSALCIIKAVMPMEIAVQAKEEFQTILPSETVLWGYFANSNLLGFSGYFVNNEQLWLSWTAVDRHCQGRGIGLTLLNRVLEDIDKEKWKEIQVTTYDHSDFHRAIAFYLKSGFHIYAVVPRYLNDGSSIIYMKKGLW
jgi:ribosomal protein S18 acetylase RimI-like enzyme